MDLEQVDIVHVEPLQAVVHRLEQRLAGKATGVRCPLPGQEGLGRHHDLVAMGEFGQQFPITSSDAPSEYMLAVSKKLIPASMASRMKGRDWS